MNKIKAFPIALLTVFALVSIPVSACLAATSAQIKAAYNSYLSDYNELKSAIDRGTDSETIRKIAEKYRDSLENYKKMAGGGKEEAAPAETAAGEQSPEAVEAPPADAAKAPESGDDVVAKLREAVKASTEPARTVALKAELAMALLKYRNDGESAASLLKEITAAARTLQPSPQSGDLLKQVAALQKAIALRDGISKKRAVFDAKKKAYDKTSALNPIAKMVRKVECIRAETAYKNAIADYRSLVDGENRLQAFRDAVDPVRNDSKAKFVFILLDGTRQDIFKKLLEENRLPNIKKLIDSGVMIENGISVLPSTTGPAYAPFVMGVGPLKSKLSGIRLFDRTTGTYRVYCGTDNGKINEDLSTDFPTIYELLSDKNTLSVFGMVDRGVAKSGVPWVQVAYNKISKDYDAMDRSLVEKLIKETRGGMPVFSFISVHGPDSNGHSFGAKKEYCDSIVFEDSLVGMIVDHVRRLGESDRVNFVISSDHGLATSSQSYDVDAALAKDLKVNAYHSIPRNTIDFNLLKFRFKADVITAVSGNACVLVYVKKQGSRDFSARPSVAELRNYPDREKKGKVDLIKFFATKPGIRHVLYGSNGKYFAESARGKAEIGKRGDDYSYAVLEGEDPFGYSASPAASKLVGGSFHSKASWLDATCDLDYPDVPLLAADLLDSACGGDIVLLAAPDFEPWNEGQKGLHGNLSYDQVRVPIVMSGPAFRRGAKIRAARTVDVFPTMVKVLGRRVPEGIDGRVIEEALK